MASILLKEPEGWRPNPVSEPVFSDGTGVFEGRCHHSDWADFEHSYFSTGPVLLFQSFVSLGR